MTYRILATALVFGALVVGCNDQDAPMESITEPSFDFMNGPPMPGNSHIYRYDWGLWYLYWDLPPVYVAVLGLGVDDPANSGFCDGSPYSTIHWQDLCPKDRTCDVLMSLGKARVTQHIYDYETFIDNYVWNGETWEFDYCAAVKGPRVAEGYGRLVDHYTDLFGSETRAKNWGFSATGTLKDLVNGGCAHFSSDFRYLYKPDGTWAGWKVAKINLHHTNSSSCMD
jgi:hypothetical protein